MRDILCVGDLLVRLIGKSYNINITKGCSLLFESDYILQGFLPYVLIQIIEFLLKKF